MPHNCSQCGTAFSTPIQLRAHRPQCAALLPCGLDAFQLALSQQHQESRVTPDEGARNSDSTAAGLMRAAQHLGISADCQYDIRQKMQQLCSQGQHGFAAVLPMIAVMQWTNDQALVDRLTKSHSDAVADGKDLVAAREAMSTEALKVAAETFQMSHQLTETVAGLAQLVSTGVFTSSGTQLGQVVQQLNSAQEALACRLQKQVLREQIAEGRNALMRAPPTLRTSIAARVFAQHGDRIEADMRRDGFSTVDHVLGEAQCAVLHAHFSKHLEDGRFGPTSTDACNKGSFSMQMPNEVGAGPDPDMQMVQQALRADPSQSQAFTTAFALRDAMGLLIGSCDELMQRLEGLKLTVPPTAMMAVYPPGQDACYHRHLDWYPCEVGNDRELTIMLYINPDWSQEDEGELVLHRGHPQPNGNLPHPVLPVGGRMVFFFSRTQWHEVRPTRCKNRFAFTLWVDRDTD